MYFKLTCGQSTGAEQSLRRGYFMITNDNTMQTFLLHTQDEKTSLNKVSLVAHFCANSAIATIALVANFKLSWLVRRVIKRSASFRKDLKIAMPFACVRVILQC